MQQQRDRSIRVRNLTIAGLIVVALAVFAMFAIPWTRERILGERAHTPPAGSGPAAPAARPSGPDAVPGSAPGDAAPQVVEQEAREQAWTRAVGSPPVWPGDLAAPADCERIDHALDEVCAALDSASDPELVASSGGACNLLREVSRDLAARPPDGTSELRSHQAILSNVFHAFRVLGRRRLQLLRQTLEGRRELAEPLSLAHYRWLVSREECESDRAVPVSRSALYDYAGFVFTTMGGQAYLRRRTPRVESLACFYALQVIDQAVAAGRNPQGLDPRPEIRRCLELMRAQPFVFTDRYVESLEAMDRRWRAAGS